MKALLDRASSAEPGWKISGFLIDDAAAEIDPIRQDMDIFGCPVLFSLWRLRRSWLRNIFKRCAHVEVQREIFKRLGKIVHGIWSGDDVLAALEELTHDFSRLVSAQADNLHSSYWLDRYADESDYFQNVKEEYIASTSWNRALQIPDSAVTFDEKDRLFAQVSSQENTSVAHIVWNPGSEFAFCDCAWSLQGNFCKHAIKVHMICQDRESYQPSMSFQSFKEILTNLSRKPVDDSISLDLSMAWTHQMLDQIRHLVELNSSNDIRAVVNKMPSRLVSAQADNLHSSYWLDRYADESDYFQNVKEEYIASTSWNRALQIPDSAVTFDEKDRLFAQVSSQENTSVAHIVWNPGSEFAFCDCAWSLQGNFCKHAIKVHMICQDRESYQPSMSFQSFKEILTNLSRKPVDDSISLDLSMAWTHQMLDQIRHLVELNSSNDIRAVVNKMPVKWVSKKD
ncbi:hypothetical protein Tsubulata_043562, partial [Turnera subulata]